jgi:hypothetical protein
MDWFKKGMVTFSLAMGKAEKDTFAQAGSEDVLRNNASVVSPMVSNQLMQDLKEGRLVVVGLLHLIKSGDFSERDKADIIQ